MGSRPKWTIIQTRHTEDQKKKKKNPHEKMLNITDYYRNANQNSNEISTRINQNGYHQKIHRQ